MPRIWKWSFAGIAFSAVAWAALIDVGHGDDTSTPSKTPHMMSSKAQDANLMMFYYNTKWDKVLKDYARHTGMDLDIRRVPPDRFMRTDRAKISPEDGLKLLQREMTVRGYRLIRQGNKLICIDKQSLKKDYEKPEMARGEEAAPPVGPRREDFVDIRKPVRPVAGGRVSPAVAEKPAGSGQRGAILQAGGTLPRLEEDEEAAEVMTAPRIALRVQVRRKDAVGIAKQIYNGFVDNAELIGSDARGLPAFEVFSIPTKAKPAKVSRFVMSIDKENDQLLIEAPRPVAQMVARLVKTLDAAREGDGSVVRPVATSKDAAKVADALREPIQQIVFAQQAEPQAEADEPRARPAPRPAAGAAAVPMNQAGLVIGSVQNDVQVEAIPELGILILRGNQEDVEKVMAIIRQIEQLSTSTAPDIELLMLEHVSSESIAALLNDIYTRLRGIRTSTSQQSQQVSIIPLVRPNAILIMASTADMEDVRDLASSLDLPSDPKMEFRVFRLKNAVASQVLTQITALFPQPSSTGAIGGAGTTTQTDLAGMAPRVRASVDVRTNAIIVQARPRDQAEVAALIKELDEHAPETVSQVKIIPLDHASSDELAVTMQTAIQSIISPPQQLTTQGQGNVFGGFGQGGTGQTPQELRDVRSSILQLIKEDGSGNLRSGLLTDIRVNSDPRTNSLVITAPAVSMEILEELVKRFDQPPRAVADIKVFPLVNSDATTMVTMLTQLFTAQGQQGGGANAQNQQQGLAVADAEDLSSQLIPLRFSADTRTNSVLAVGGAAALRVVEAVLLRLDQSDIRQRQTTVYKLKNSPATDIATAISNFLTARRDINAADPGLVSPYETLDREVLVIPEPITNSLLISSTPRYFEEIKELVLRLDSQPAQVIIQALIVEVSLDDTNEFGIDVGLQDSVLFNRSVKDAPTTISTTTTAANGQQTTTQTIIAQTATPGFLFNNQPVGNNIAAAPGSLAGQALSNLGIGRLNTDLGFGGLVLAASNESISVLIRALAGTRRVDILSRPQIRTVENQLAQIQVGQQVPRVSGFNQNVTTGNSTPLIDQTDVGVILSVTPRVGPDNQIIMEVVAVKSGIQAGTGASLGTNPDGSTITSPILDITQARTTLAVHSGQTAVLGGMITKQNTNILRKVPLLGDIPILGYAFRYELNTARRTELLIFLTPRLISNDYEAETIKQIEMDRLHFVEEEAIDIHGPLRAFDRALECLPDGTPTSIIDAVPPQTPAMTPGAWPLETSPQEELFVPLGNGQKPDSPPPLNHGQGAPLPPVPMGQSRGRNPKQDAAIQQVSAQAPAATRRPSTRKR